MTQDVAKPTGAVLVIIVTGESATSVADVMITGSASNDFGDRSLRATSISARCR